MTKLWVGLDVGGEITNYCVTDADGLVISEGATATSSAALGEVLSVYQRSDIQLVGAEAGTGLHLIRELRNSGFPAVIFESTKASRVLAVRRNKTDINDARGLADVGRLGGNVVPRVHLKSIECQQLRSQLTMREQLVRQRVAGEACLRSTLGLYGGRLKSIRSAKSLRAQVIGETSRIAAEQGIDLAADLEPLVVVCESIRDYIAQADRKLLDAANNIPICRRFLDIPGVGSICALSFYSAIEEPSRFTRIAGVGSYLGLTPRVRQSGQYHRALRVSKMGDERVRARLIMAARVILGKYRGDVRLKDWGLELSGRAGSKKAWVAVARKLAIVMLSMWKNDRPFNAYPAPS